jgi:hypothetical protein
MIVVLMAVFAGAVWMLVGWRNGKAAPSQHTR